MNPVTIAAVYTMCAHYHSGQASRGYRLLCMAERAWERRAGIGVRLDYWERCVEDPASLVGAKYRQLTAMYGGDL